MKTFKYLLAVLFLAGSLPSSAQKKNIKTETFKVSGTCEQCKNRIEKTLSGFGTYKADWNAETNMLTVSYDSIKLSKSKIQQKLALQGHDTEEFQAEESTYKSLPMCCHYDRHVNPAVQLVMDTMLMKENTPKLYTITGIVLEEDKKGKMLPLAGATVRCLNTNHTSATDNSGVFQLSCIIPVQVVVSYIGFQPDTLNITSPNEIKVILKNASTTNLQQVVVTSRNPSTRSLPGL